MVVAFSLGALPTVVLAQQATLRGTVTAQDNGQALEDVAVMLETAGQHAYGAFTNKSGIYRIEGIRPGTYTLMTRLIGYKEHEQTVTVTAGQSLTVDFRLEQAAVELEGIVVSPEKGAAVKDLGRQVVTPRDIHVVPIPGGSGDLVSYLQTLPGVTTTGDRGGQIFVRGGTPAGNLVLVDGIPIYQPFHILGFFSVFPEDLVKSADFYAGGFGARYHGRTSSVLDVHLREGDPNHAHATASLSPFIAEGLAEGPLGSGSSWMVSIRHSLVEQTSQALLGSKQPLSFESELVKLTDNRCSLLSMHTADRGRIDPEDTESHVSWNNLLLGLKCISLRSNGQRVEANWSYSGSSSDALSRGSSNLHASIWRMQHDLHAAGLVGGIPVQAGYEIYVENLDYNLEELFTDQARHTDGVFGVSGYVEAGIPVGDDIEVKPGVVLDLSPRPGVEPRLRASWNPWGASGGTLEGALGLYRQDVVGTSDMRDVSSVFTAWLRAPDGVPQTALHAILGWQQPLGGGLRGSLEGYYKRLWDIPVPILEGVAQFQTRLGRADGHVYGADARIEYTSPRFYGFVGYGYNWTLYEAAQSQFADWFGEPVLSYHPPHDRRNQVNALASLELAGFKVSARWQFGSGLPFTRPMGFDEAFDYSRALYDPHTNLGTTRILLDRPFTGRLPMVHRLDLSLERAFELSFGELHVQAGAINAYDRRNMFYYDLFTGRRLDQLPLAPYLSATLKTR